MAVLCPYCSIFPLWGVRIWLLKCDFYSGNSNTLVGKIRRYLCPHLALSVLVCCILLSCWLFLRVWIIASLYLKKSLQHLTAVFTKKKASDQFVTEIMSVHPLTLDFGLLLLFFFLLLLGDHGFLTITVFHKREYVLIHARSNWSCTWWLNWFRLTAALWCWWSVNCYVFSQLLIPSSTLYSVFWRKKGSCHVQLPI